MSSKCVRGQTGRMSRESVRGRTAAAAEGERAESQNIAGSGQSGPISLALPVILRKSVDESESANLLRGSPRQVEIIEERTSGHTKVNQEQVRRQTARAASAPASSHTTTMTRRKMASNILRLHQDSGCRRHQVVIVPLSGRLIHGMVIIGRVEQQVVEAAGNVTVLQTDPEREARPEETSQADRHLLRGKPLISILVARNTSARAPPFVHDSLSVMRVVMGRWICNGFAPALGALMRTRL